MFIPINTIFKLLKENNLESILAVIILILLLIIVSQITSGRKLNKSNYQYYFNDDKALNTDKETKKRLFFLDNNQIQFIQTYSKLNSDDKQNIKLKMYNISKSKVT